MCYQFCYMLLSSFHLDHRYVLCIVCVCVCLCIFLPCVSHPLTLSVCVYVCACVNRERMPASPLKESLLRQVSALLAQVNTLRAQSKAVAIGSSAFAFSSAFGQSPTHSSRDQTPRQTGTQTQAQTQTGTQTGAQTQRETQTQTERDTDTELPQMSAPLFRRQVSAAKSSAQSHTLSTLKALNTELGMFKYTNIHTDRDIHTHIRIQQRHTQREARMHTHAHTRS